MSYPIHELTTEERFTWGECPVCKAAHGQKCDGSIGIPLGLTVSGKLPDPGAHLSRLQAAPHRVRLVPV